MKPQPISRSNGFSLVELMVVLAVTAVVMSLAFPSIQQLLARKRVEGFTSELATDLQYARSEAVQKNVGVRLTLGSSCYAVHLATATVASNCAVTPAASGFKVVSTSGIQSLNLSPSTGFIGFDPVRGMRETGSIESINATSSATSSVQLRAAINFVGRVSVCSVVSNYGGYPTC